MSSHANHATSATITEFFAGLAVWVLLMGGTALF
jgi:hypothetical protein